MNKHNTKSLLWNPKFSEKEYNLSMDSTIQPQTQSKVLTFFIFYNLTLIF